MKLKDILPANPIELMARMFLPEKFQNFPEEDTLFGYCFWDGNKLIPHDNDSYSLDDEIEKHEIWQNHNEAYLVYWIKTEWM